MRNYILQNWQVTSRKNKVMVLGIVNREILINDYQIGRLSYNVSIPSYNGN